MQSLLVEHYTCSSLSQGYWRLHGSLSNQSTLVLWTWKRHMDKSPGDPVGGALGVQSARPAVTAHYVPV